MGNNIIYLITQAVRLCEKEFNSKINVINYNDIISHWWPDLMLRLYKGNNIEDALQQITLNETRNVLKQLSLMYYLPYHGELDSILSHYFPIDYKGIFVEVGSGHWEILNDSLHFERNGWTCYCFEPNPLYYEELSKNRSNTYNIALSDDNKDNVDFYLYDTNFPYGVSQMAGSGLNPACHNYNHLGDTPPSLNKIIKVNQRKLSDVLPPDIKIDIMTIDVEEHEYQVLCGINFNIHSPDIMVLENTFENEQCRQYLYGLSYELINRCGINDIFKKKTFNQKLFS